MASLTDTIIVRRNPFNTVGEYTTPERLAFLTEEYRRVKPLYESWVRAGRMLPENRDHKLGILEALIKEHQLRQLRHLPPELCAGPAVVVNFRSHADAAAFEEAAPTTFTGICAIRPA